MVSIRAKAGLFLSLAVGAFSFNASAYDVDTHFYATYLMARFSGIAKEPAEKIAASAQWMDESYLSDPVSMILLPITGVAKRRLLHFPADRVTGVVNGSMRDESYGIKEDSPILAAIAEAVVKVVNFKGDLHTIAINEKTVANHEFGNAMLNQGLKEGNLMKAGTGLHTLEDSYAHGGTRPIEGHSLLWHWPDRPYHEMEKYRDMTVTVLRAMTAIRAQLPPEGIDCSLTQFGQKPTCQMGPEELAAAYQNTPQVWSTVGHNVLKDPQYIRFALRDALRRAVNLKYFDDVVTADQGKRLETILEESINTMMLRGRADTYAILVIFLNKLLSIEKSTGQKIFNRAFIREDMGLGTDPNVSYEFLVAQQVNSMPPKFQSSDPTGGRMAFEYRIASRILSGFVPVPIDAYNKTEKEDDNAVTRQFEMKLRIENMQALIKTLLGEEIIFVENNTANDDGFAFEVLRDKRATPKIKRENPNARYVTFNAEEKRRFDLMVFNYLFPSLTEGDLVRLVTALRNAKVAAEKPGKKEIDPETGEVVEPGTLAKIKINVQTGLRYVPLWWIATFTPIVKDCMVAIAPMIMPFLDDLLNQHLKPKGDEKAYQNPQAFALWKANPVNKGKYAQFYGPGDTWTRNAQTAELDLQAPAKVKAPAKSHIAGPIPDFDKIAPTAL